MPHFCKSTSQFLEFETKSHIQVITHDGTLSCSQVMETTSSISECQESTIYTYCQWVEQVKSSHPKCMEEVLGKFFR